MLTTTQVKSLHRGTYVRKRGCQKLVRVAYTCNYGMAIYYYRGCDCLSSCDCNYGGKANKRKICREQLEVVGDPLDYNHHLRPGDWVKDVKREKWYRFICMETLKLHARQCMWVEEYNGRFFSQRRAMLSQIAQQRFESIETIFDYNLSGNVAIRIPVDQVKCLQMGDVIRSVCGERHLVEANEVRDEHRMFGKLRILRARKILAGNCYGGIVDFGDSDGYTPVEEEGVNLVMSTPKFKKGDVVVFTARVRMRTENLKSGTVLTIKKALDECCEDISYYVKGHSGTFSEDELEIQKITVDMIDEKIKELESEQIEVDKKLKIEKEMLAHLMSTGQTEITPLELKCYMAIEAFDGKSSKFEKAKAIATLFEDLR